MVSSWSLQGLEDAMNMHIKRMTASHPCSTEGYILSSMQWAVRTIREAQESQAKDAVAMLEPIAKGLYEQQGRLGVDYVGWNYETDEVKAEWIGKAALQAMKSK